MNWLCINQIHILQLFVVTIFIMWSLNYKVFTFYLYNLGRGVAKSSKVTDSVKLNICII